MLHGRTEFTGKRRMCGGYGMCEKKKKKKHLNHLNLQVVVCDTDDFHQLMAMIIFHDFDC